MDRKVNESEYCNQPCARCFCHLPAGHETPHVCCCGGSYAIRGKELHVYALPPGYLGVVLDDDEVLALANRYARSKPILIEEFPPEESSYAVPPFRTGRGAIRFLQPPESEGTGA